MSSKPMILLIEPNRAEAQTLMRVLGSGPYDAILAQTPEEGIAYLEAPIDLVVSGIGPSEPHGRDVLHQWRTSRPATPFILIAGNDFDSALVFPPISAAECIRRPINSDELLRRIAGRISVSRNQSDRGASHSSNGESDSRRETLESRPPAIVIPPGATLSDLESAAIKQSLERHQGNRTHAAKALGISVRTLQRKLKAWKVSPPTANVRRAPETVPRDNWSTNGGLAQDRLAQDKTLKARLATI